MAIHRVIEGPCAGTTWTALTTLGPTTINYIQVPDGYNTIAEIWVTMAMSTATDAKGCLGAVRLRGDGMVYTPFEFFVGGSTHGTKTTSGSQIRHMRPFKGPAGLMCKSGGQINVDGCQTTGADAGTAEFAVELVFTKGGGRKRYSYVRYASATALDTKTELTLDAESTTVNQFIVPSDCSKITAFVPAVGAITLTTATGGTTLFKLEGAIPDGNQCLPGPGGSALNTTDGICSGIYETETVPTMLEVEPGGRLFAYGEQTGVDWGTVYTGLTLVFE